VLLRRSRIDRFRSLQTQPRGVTEFPQRFVNFGGVSRTVSFEESFDSSERVKEGLFLILQALGPDVSPRVKRLRIGRGQCFAVTDSFLNVSPRACWGRWNDKIRVHVS
jgi:hypothetical protein